MLINRSSHPDVVAKLLTPFFITKTNFMARESSKHLDP